MADLREIFYSLKKISDKWDPYFDVYEKHFARFIGKSPKILEIGVQNGGSIDMWVQYFGEGTQIVGIDVLPQCAELQYPENVEIIIGDQSSNDFWDGFLSNHTDFDIVIDDGGHTMIQQIVTLNRVFPHVKDNGVVLCEDTHTSYWKDWGGGWNNSKTFLHYAKELTDYINKEHLAPGYISKKNLQIFKNQLNSITFYNSMVVFEKQAMKPFERVFSRV